MNYRHSFHAGNFADLVKHAVVLDLLARLTTSARPLRVIDTHAGGGLYDLSGDAARSKEAEAGIARLMATDGALPRPLRALAERVRVRNADGEVRWYPGSPLLIAESLRRGDRYLGHELRPEECDRLVETLTSFPNAEARNEDGYPATLAALSGDNDGAVLVLIDPPFERGDDYQRAAETAGAVVRARPDAVAAVWTPIKDMETFDGFLRRLQAASARDAVVAEARLRPLANPMKMNGCAMVVLNAPTGAEAAMVDVCAWVVERLGDPGGRAEVWRT